MAWQDVGQDVEPGVVNDAQGRAALWAERIRDLHREYKDVRKRLLEAIGTQTGWSNGEQYAIMLDDDVRIAGDLDEIGEVETVCIEYWDGNKWAVLDDCLVQVYDEADRLVAALLWFVRMLDR